MAQFVKKNHAIDHVRLPLPPIPSGHDLLRPTTPSILDDTTALAVHIADAATQWFFFCCRADE